LNYFAFLPFMPYLTISLIYSFLDKKVHQFCFLVLYEKKLLVKVHNRGN